MKKGLKITLIVAGVVIGLPLLTILGLMGYALVQLLFFSLPTDGPRVVATQDWEFQAPEGWFTQCSSEAPNCIAVALDPGFPTWKEKKEWIEVQPVDASGVTDTASFGALAQKVGQQLVEGRIDGNLQSPDPAHEFYDGVDTYTVVNMAVNDYWRTLFAKLPNGSIVRFTCHAPDYDHDEACANALGAIAFPAARAAFEERQAAEAARLAAEQEAKRVAAERRAQAARETVVTPTGADPNDVYWTIHNRLRAQRKAQDDAIDREFAKRWSGPGWYRVNKTVNYIIEFFKRDPGPYGSEAECLGGGFLPAGQMEPDRNDPDFEETHDYLACIYLYSAPKTPRSET